MSMFRAAVMAMAVSAALALGACGNNENSGSSTTNTAATGSANAGGKTYKVYLLPKVKGVPYFETCDQGAQEAAKELGDVDLQYDGPVDGHADEAAQLVKQWALQGADVIAVSVNDPAVLAPAMKDAQNRGVHVITWDADAAPDTRELFVNQATAEQIGDALVDTLAKDIDPSDPKAASGEVAIITATLTAANQNEWMKYMKQQLEKYPQLKLVDVEPSDDNQTKAKAATETLIKAHPDLKGVWAISSAAFPGAAEAIEQQGKAGKIQVTGLSTPNDMKKYVMDGTVKSVVLWNTKDLGYLTVYTAEAVASGKYHKGDTSIKAGRLGDRKIVDGQVLLGDILVFNKDNIGKYDF
ncbi:MAG TPA: substrate-binding domain-containing protein [Phycisphaerae bacterium]|jgi:ABC-type sugar transport system substrate-binding protein|nr:substrate-binding domain-containing protein [Phycisphaerae bacterium]